MISIEYFNKLLKDSETEKAKNGKLYKIYKYFVNKRRLLGFTSKPLDWDIFYTLSVMAQEGYKCCEYLGAPEALPSYILSNDGYVKGNRMSIGLIGNQDPFWCYCIWELCEMDGLSDLDEKLVDISAGNLLKRLKLNNR